MQKWKKKKELQRIKTTRQQFVILGDCGTSTTANEMYINKETQKNAEIISTHLNWVLWFGSVFRSACGGDGGRCTIRNMSVTTPHGVLG